MFCECFVVHLEKPNFHSFYTLGGHAIFTVDELKDLVPGGPHCGVVLDLNILECLDQTSLDIACISCLYSCVDQTLSASHCVEVEFLRSQSRHVVVCNEAFTLWAKIILTKMRKRPSIESKWDTFSFYVLLTYTSHDL